MHSGRQLVEHNPECVDIGCRGNCSPLKLLRRAALGSAKKAARHSESCFPSLSRRKFVRQTEVHDHGTSAAITADKHDVAALQIAMDETRRMDRCKCRADVKRDPFGVDLGDGAMLQSIG